MKRVSLETLIETHSTPEFSMGLETDISVFSTTIPKRCEVFSSLFANIRRTFGEHFFEVRAPKMQLALRLEFLEIRTGRYIHHQQPTIAIRQATVPVSPATGTAGRRRRSAQSARAAGPRRWVGPLFVVLLLARRNARDRASTPASAVARRRARCQTV